MATAPIDPLVVPDLIFCRQRSRLEIIVAVVAELVQELEFIIIIIIIDQLVQLIRRQQLVLIQVQLVVLLVVRIFPVFPIGDAQLLYRIHLRHHWDQTGSNSPPTPTREVSTNTTATTQRSHIQTTSANNLASNITGKYLIDKVKTREKIKYFFLSVFTYYFKIYFTGKVRRK